MTADSPQVLEEDVDRHHHEESFARAGVQLEYRFWSDRSIDWYSYDLIVIRSLWDYPERMGELAEFLELMSSVGRVHNPPELIRWNLDKSYLLDLAAMGVPVVRTFVAKEISQVTDAIVAIGNSGSTEIVVKPVVSASSRCTGWFDIDDVAAVDLAHQILTGGGHVLVEPFVSSVARHGEVAAIMFDGEFSHAIRKGPLLAKGGGLIGGVYREEISPHEVTAAELSTATIALAATTDKARRHEWVGPDEDLLYGRFDIVELDDGSTALLEAELFEPCLFVPFSDGAAERFTRACISRAEGRSVRAVPPSSERAHLRSHDPMR